MSTPWYVFIFVQRHKFSVAKIRILEAFCPSKGFPHWNQVTLNAGISDITIPAETTFLFIPVLPAVELNLFNYTRCNSNFSICEDEKLYKERKCSSSLCQVHFKISNFAFEKPNYFIPEALLLLQAVKTPLKFNCHSQHVLLRPVQHPSFV